MRRIWNFFWAWAGRVPLRQKVIGIVVTSLLILGFSIGLWVQSGLGDWLSYLLSEERVSQAMAAGTRGVFIITILAALAGLFIAWLLTWILTRPILHITAVAKGVEKGDLSHRAPVWANDEIGQLGLAFNAMIESMAKSRTEISASNDQLLRQNQELAALYMLAGMACQAVNRDLILEEGLEKVLDITGADVGKIALQDPIDKSLKLKAARNVPQELLDNPSFLDQQHWFYNEVLETGETLFIPEITDVPEALSFATSSDYHTFVSVPIKVKGEVQGVMNILHRTAAQIGRDDVRFVETVCSALGVAIENSYLWDEVVHKEASRTRLLAKVVTAQEEERRRISRELHDETGQALTTLLVQLKVLKRTTDLPSLQNQIEDLRDLTVQTLEDVHRISLDLRPSALDDLGLVPALKWYIDERASKNGVAVHLDAHDLDDIRLPHEIEDAFYRIIQEALTNVIRHADAENAWVKLSKEADLVTIVIMDDGCGFNLDRISDPLEVGLGLLGMRERIELIGGSFKLDSAPGKGAQIRVQIKLPPDPPEGRRSND